MKLYMRAYYVDRLKRAFAYADSRLAEGRSLIVGVPLSPASIRGRYLGSTARTMSQTPFLQ
jgi:hypothetical protein